MLAAAVALVAAVAVVYAPVREAGFFYLDDDLYVTRNPMVRDGLTLAGLGRAFFDSHGALWMPLAFTSHMIDVSLFGLDPTGPHLVNVLLHAVNAALLLVLLWRTTGALAPSAIAAALFALHPLRVESVAWIAERKDVLSGLFGLLAAHAWVAYARTPDARRYRLVLLAALLAMLSKPMLVTLPLLFLCLDVWPLRRLDTPGPDGRPLGAADLVREKLPLVLLAGAVGAATLVAAGAQGALVALDDRPLAARLAHAVLAGWWYVGKTLWPSGLGAFYPTPAWNGWQIVGATLALGASGWAAWRVRRSAPWIAAGLAWFASGLLPVIGLFQAGAQGMADRFTYLPAVGLVVAVVWTFHETVRRPAGRAALGGAGVVAALALGVVAHRQAGHWRTSEAMLRRTLDVTGPNWRMEEALGNVLANEGRWAEALGHFTRALTIQPASGAAAYGIGLALDGLGRSDDAVARWRDAVRLDPAHWRAHNNLGVYHLRRARFDVALHHLSEAVRLQPADRNATENLRSALAAAGFPADGADGYVQGLVTWSTAIGADRSTALGAAYGARLAPALLAAAPTLVEDCAGDAGDGAPPFSLYVQVDADGTLSAVTAIPPTAAARCARDRLRAVRAPAPPFAPFHGSVPVASPETSLVRRP